MTATTTAAANSKATSSKAKSPTSKGKKATAPKGKKEVAAAAPATKEKSALTKREITVLTALKGGKPMTRTDLKAATGIAKGWSKLFGAATKKNFGGNSDGMEPRGLVKSSRAEGSKVLTYAITEAGAKALAVATAK